MKRGESPEAAVQLIALEQIDKALAEIHDPELPLHETVHQVRTRTKKLRALLRAGRPGLGKQFRRENKRYRDMARGLSKVRDAEALIEALETLRAPGEGRLEEEALERAHRALAARRDGMAAHKEEVEARLHTFEQALLEGRKAVSGWRIDGGLDVIVRGITKSHAQGRQAMKRAIKTGADGDLHEWRKRVKDLRYQLNLVRPLWKGVLGALHGEVKRLSDLLGEDHDLAMLGELLDETAGELVVSSDVEALQHLVLERRMALFDDFRRLGGRVYGEAPKGFGRRLTGYLKVWERVG